MPAARVSKKKKASTDDGAAPDTQKPPQRAAGKKKPRAAKTTTAANEALPVAPQAEQLNPGTSATSLDDDEAPQPTAGVAEAAPLPQATDSVKPPLSNQGADGEKHKHAATVVTTDVLRHTADQPRATAAAKAPLRGPTDEQLAMQHPHWRTFQLTVAWLDAAQRAVEDVAAAVTKGNIGRALGGMGIPPATLLFNPEADAFDVVPSGS